MEMLFSDAPEDDLDIEAVKKKGPPNRINDLNYSTWMKYQKITEIYTSLTYWMIYKENSLLRIILNFLH